MKSFKYIRAQNVEDACELLDSYGHRAVPVAGGTDLLVKMKRHLLKPEVVIDLTGVNELKYITAASGCIKIGALTPLGEIAASFFLSEKVEILARSAGLVGSKQIRNLATIGGNLCNAAPSADTAAPLLVLEATAHIIGSQGQREVALEDFFTGPGRTCLTRGEILAAVSFTEPPAQAKNVYLKYTRRKAMDIASVGVALSLVPGENVRARIAFASVAPVPIRIAEVEQAIQSKFAELNQEEMNKDAARQIAILASAMVRPISDVRATAEYRKRLVKVLVARALEECITGMVRSRIV